MKFLLMGDRHNSEQKPQNRIDDFFETQRLKDEEIVNIAKKYNVSAILQAGDFWTDGDTKIKNDFIPQIIKRWIDPLNPAASIPMIGIAGNHDLIGGNIRSLPNTTLGLTAELGYQRLVSKDNPVIFTLENGKTVAITGTNYHINMDKPEYIDDYIVDKKLGDYHIHIVHGMLSPRNLGKIIRHTTIDAIKSTAADITFCGHDHIGFDTVCYDNKYFVNPGAIVRLKNDVKELSRTVKVIILTIDDTGISLEEVPLKTALESSKVLSREQVEQRKEKEAAAEKMKSEIKSLEITQHTRFSEILEDVFKKEEVSEPIMEDLRKRIATKELQNNSFLSVPKDVAFESIIIDNFQSHEHTEIDLSEGFNVFLGESRQGKTAVMRACRWVLENKPLGTSVIRHGATKASVTIKLKNGTFITRFIGSKENGYKVILPDGTVQEGNTHMVGMVQSLCGFNDMDINNGLSMPINFLRQGMGWYLIDDNTSATERARILGSLQNTQSADAIVKDLDKENSQLSTNIKTNLLQIDKTLEDVHKLTSEREHMEKIKKLLEAMLLKQRIQEYMSLKKEVEKNNKQVDVLSNAYNKIVSENKLSLIKSLLDKHLLISSEVEKASNQKKILESSTKKISLCDEVIKNSSKIEVIKNKINIYSEIHSNASTVFTERKRQKKINGMLDRLSGYKDKLIPEIKRLLDLRITLTDATNTYRRQSRTIKQMTLIIDKTESVLSADKKVNMINTLLERKSVIQNEFNLSTKYKKDIELTNKKIESLNKEEESLKSKKAQTLKDAKICPICSQIITDEVTHNILGGHE